jgi:hypothetical protein
MASPQQPGGLLKLRKRERTEVKYLFRFYVSNWLEPLLRVGTRKGRDSVHKHLVSLLNAHVKIYMHVLSQCHEGVEGKRVEVLARILMWDTRWGWWSATSFVRLFPWGHVLWNRQTGLLGHSSV